MYVEEVLENKDESAPFRTLVIRRLKGGKSIHDRGQRHSEYGRWLWTIEYLGTVLFAGDVSGHSFFSRAVCMESLDERTPGKTRASFLWLCL